MRSKAPPPMSAREAMQFSRDGAQRSCRTGAAELSKECAQGGAKVGTLLRRCRLRAARESYETFLPLPFWSSVTSTAMSRVYCPGLPGWYSSAAPPLPGPLFGGGGKAGPLGDGEAPLGGR